MSKNEYSTLEASRKYVRKIKSRENHPIAKSGEGFDDVIAAGIAAAAVAQVKSKMWETAEGKAILEKMKSDA